MYVIKAQNAADNGWTTIYDSSDKALCLISQPKHDSELNQSGSFDFTIYPDSPFYDSIIPMDTFISAFEGYDVDHLDETFYGRVLTCEDDYYGIKNVSCEGILSFLKDATVGRVSTDDKNSGREYQTSPSAFLQEQLEAYNDKVEPRKQLIYGGVSGITTSDAETFKIDDDQDFGSLLMGQLIDVYGGFFKITRLQDGSHELSYVKNYGINAGTAQKIWIGQNILDKQKHMSGEGVFTFIRPVGKDGVRLEDKTYHGVVCNSSNGRSGLYPVGTDAESFAAIYNRYGFIERTKSFDDCETSDALVNACSKYVRDYGMDALDKLPMTFDVKLVDFFNANTAVKRIELGTNYISTVDDEGRETGFEGHAFGDSLRAGQTGLTLTVYSMHRDYENPENDSVTFYNATFLTAKDYSVILSSMTGTYSEGGGSRGGLSGRVASKDVEEQEQFKQFETFYEKTDQKFSWLATESEWDELSQSGHVTAFTDLDRTARYVLSTAKKELPFDDWKDQWLVAHPGDASLSDTELREKYNTWITENPYAIYNEDFTSATRTERIISKTGINELGENETITSRIIETADNVLAEISSSTSGIYSVMERSLSNFRVEIADEVSGYKSVVNRTSRYVVDAAMAELPFDDWKDQWLFAHPDDKDLSDEELREKYNTWIAENPYAIYNSEYSDATRTERIISKTGINDLGEDETITARITEEAGLIRSQIESSTSGIYSVMELSLNSFRVAIGNDVAGYKTEIETTNNTFRAEVNNTLNDMYSRIIAWEGGAAIEVRQGNRTFKQFDAPAFTLPDGDTLKDGDIWVKSTDMRTWGETSGKEWGDAKDFHWDDYVGDEVYVWKNGKWTRVLSEKELVVQGHRFQTTIDETWDVIDDTANGLRVEMSRTASRFYQTYTELDGRTSTLEQDVDHFKTEISDAQGNISSLTQTANGIESRVSDAEDNISTVTQTATQLLSRVENAEGNIGSVQTTANSVAIQVAKKTKTYIQWADPRSTLTNWEEELTVGDIWVKSNAMRKWADVGGTDWKDSTGYQWDDYRGSQQFVWRRRGEDNKTGYWELINSQKDAVVNAARLETEQDRIWAVVDDNDNKLRAEMEMTASRFYRKYTDDINNVSSEIVQTASTIRETVGRIDTLEDGVTAIEGSNLWLQRDNLSLISGSMYVDKNGVLHINEGGGMVVDRRKDGTLTSFGIYDSDTLTAGVMVEKITGDSSNKAIGVKLGTFVDGYLDAGTVVSKITGSTSVAMGTYINNQLDAGVMVEKITGDSSNKTVGVKMGTYINGKLDAGTVVSKITGSTSVAMGTYINNQLDAGVMVEKITGDSSNKAVGVKLGTFVDGYLDAGTVVSKITGSTSVTMGTYINNQLDAGVMVEKITGDSSTKAVGVKMGTYINGKLDAGTVVSKITGSTSVTMGTYINNQLDAGVMVEKITGDSSNKAIGVKLGTFVDGYLDAGTVVSKITGSTSVTMGTYINNQLDAGVMVEKITGDSSNKAVGVKLGTFVDGYLDAGTVVSKITGSTSVTMGTYINNQLDAGVMVERINSSSAKASFGFYDSGTLTAGVIVNKINGGASTVAKIAANKINLEGLVTATELETQKGRIDNLVSGATQATKLWATNVTAANISIGSTSTGTVKYRGKTLTSAWLLNSDGTKKYPVLTLDGLNDSVSTGYNALGNAIYSFGEATSTNGKITIPTTKIDGTTGPSINFNIADTQYYKDGVSAAEKTGWKAARTSVGNFPASTPEIIPTSITVKKPNATVNGAAVSYKYELSVDNDYAYLKYSGNTVAQVSNSAYSSAYSNGQNSVTALIVDVYSNEQTEDIPLSAGDSITLYPAKKIGETTVKDATRSITITAEQGDSGSISSSNINMANANEINVYDSDPGDSYTKLGQLGNYVSQCANGSWITFRATCNGGADYKYYKIHVDRPRQ